MAIDRLNAEDRLMLDADGMWPQDVGALVTLDGTNLLDADGAVQIARVRQAIGARLHLVPRFRQVIHVPRRGLGGPLWLDARDFDLAQHIRVVPLPHAAGEAELLRAAEQLRRERLNRSRPLWEMWLLPGLPERRIGLLVRFHHAIADGRAAMTILAAILDSAPDAPVAEARPWTPMLLPVARALVADNLVRRARGLAGALSVLVRPLSTLGKLRAGISEGRELIGEKPVPKTSFDRLVGPERTFAVIRTSLEAVKEIGHRHDATTNDVLLALTAGGLRALLLSRGEPADLTVRTYVPVSLRRRLRGATQGNLISQMVVHLPLGEGDPGRRLQQIAAETGRIKHRDRPSMGALFRLAIVQRLVLRVIARQRVNSTITVVHGPSRPVYVSGAKVVEMFPLLNLFGNETLGVGALSYAGAFDIGVVSDRTTYPDMDVFVGGVRDDLRRLQVAAPLALTTSIAAA